MSIISLKNYHPFKIVELENFFKQKLTINSAILNRRKFFNKMMDKYRTLLWGRYNLSLFSSFRRSVAVHSFISYFSIFTVHPSDLLGSTFFFFFNFPTIKSKRIYSVKTHYSFRSEIHISSRTPVQAKFWNETEYGDRLH